jgi:hypothetical protein
MCASTARERGEWVSTRTEEKLRVVALPIECSLDMRTFVSDMTRLGTTPPLKSGAAGEVGASPLAPGPRLRPWDPWVSLRSNCGRLWGLREGDRPAPTNPVHTPTAQQPIPPGHTGKRGRGWSFTNQQ